MRRLAILFLLAATPASSEAPMGKALYEENCLECHGETAAGDDDISPDIRGVNRTMLERALPGFDQMPEFTFTDSEVAALHAYLKALAD